MQQLRQFWMDDHLCDVVLKSHDGAEHRAHTAGGFLLPVAFFQESAGEDRFWKQRGCNRSSQWKSLHPKRQCLHCWTTSMMVSLKYQWKLVLNSYDWQRLTTCQS